MSRTRKNKELYLDNAASTPVDPRVQVLMAKANKLYGNPSSYNDSGRAAGALLLRARTGIARFMNASTDEVVVTSSGSEANSLAIQGFLQSRKNIRGSEIITTSIEHPSVLKNITWASKHGVVIKYVPVAGDGGIKPEDVISLVTPKTILVSIMYANNEIGTILPVAKIGRLLKEYQGSSQTKNKSLFFHIDACQAAGYLDMDVHNLKADLLTMNGSKIYGPKGIGILYVRRGVKIEPIIRGGSQEYGLRAGTENLPAVVGMAKAVELIKASEASRLAGHRDYFLKEIKKVIPDVYVYGALGEKRLANNISISIPRLGSEYLLLELDRHGIRAGSGSACTARSVEPSHVLKAIGAKQPYIDGVLRFSLGRETTKNDMDRLLYLLPKIEKKLRSRFK